MIHMDEANYDVRGYTMLERLAHAFHMEELLVRALAVYARVSVLAASAPQLFRETCPCLTDDLATGVIDKLETMAQQIRGHHYELYTIFSLDDSQSMLYARARIDGKKPELAEKLDGLVSH